MRLVSIISWFQGRVSSVIWMHLIQLNSWKVVRARLRLSWGRRNPTNKPCSSCPRISSLWAALQIPAVVQSPSCVRHFATPWTVAHQTFLSLTISQSLPEFMSTESVMPSNHLIVCYPPSIFPSIRVFSSESALHNRRAKYGSFSLSISLSSD